MSYYLVRGGQALRGEVPISGAKNSVLPIFGRHPSQRRPQPVT